MPKVHNLMNVFEAVAIALALSMDAFAVAVATGIRLCVVSPRQIFRLSFHFGLFQFAMPVIGWFAGVHIRSYIEEWDHWLAFGLLVLVGGKMIQESLSRNDDEQKACADPTKGWSLILLSVATSLDALAVGLSIALLGQPIWAVAIGIGLVCAFLTFMGIRLGCFASQAAKLGPRAAFFGGIVLLFIGINILREHGVFG